MSSPGDSDTDQSLRTIVLEAFIGTVTNSILHYGTDLLDGGWVFRNLRCTYH